MKKRLLALAVLGMMMAVVVLVGGIYKNTMPQKDYEVIIVKGTLDTTALEEAGYFTLEQEGYILTEPENDWIKSRRKGPCPVCEAIQRGEITPTSWLEFSDNFTVIMKEGAYELEKPVIKFYPNNTHNIEVEIITSEE